MSATLTANRQKWRYDALNAEIASLQTQCITAHREKLAYIEKANARIARLQKRLRDKCAERREALDSYSDEVLIEAAGAAQNDAAMSEVESHLRHPEDCDSQVIHDERFDGLS